MNGLMRIYLGVFRYYLDTPPVLGVDIHGAGGLGGAHDPAVMEVTQNHVRW